MLGFAVVLPVEPDVVDRDPERVCDRLRRFLAAARVASFNLRTLMATHGYGLMPATR